MKILIVGHPGSGKTYLAKALSIALDTERVDIDVLYDGHIGYIISKKRYTDALHRLVEGKQAWIIDGYHAGRVSYRLVRAADRVIYLNIPTNELRQNVMDRYRLKRAHKEFSHWQAFYLNNLKNLWQIRFQDRRLRTDIYRIRHALLDSQALVEVGSRKYMRRLVNDLRSLL